jgi:multidrug resistance efflux pump
MTKPKLFITLVAFTMLCACNNGTRKTDTEQHPTASPAVTEVVAIGRVEPESKITAVGSQVNGIVKHIYVHEGDSVKKDQKIIELLHDYEDAQLLQAESKLATQKAEIDNVNAQLTSAKIKLDNLLVKLERTKRIYASDADTRQNLDNAQTEYDQALADIARYKAALSAEEAKLHERDADIAVIKAQIEQRIIKAPANGIVLNMDITEGASVNTGKGLFDFAPASPLTVLCEADELLADKIRTGQQAYIRNQGMDQKLAGGEVIFVSPNLKKKSLFSDDSGNMEDRRVREVRILLKDNTPLLFNSRVEAVINIK